MRRVYPIQLTVNGHRIQFTVIDSHYEEKHSATVNDEVILELVRSLDGEIFQPDTIDEGFEYYATEPHFFGGRPYRLIWLLPPEKNYLGVLNCYRRSHGKG